ncbi:hypothetical protein EK21DRAFT_96094 [Setomelanomma holmii]|uniref:Uncharacterized protein n=1 Tax=Setomelanomma holmii TaxID=210430 RepID=A0A9P4HM72_9PLEO|nr:hypothetical protein EK21DRAFT_96094 [Setomelanomma holmii]
MYIQAPPQMRTSSFPSTRMQCNILPQAYHTVTPPAEYSDGHRIRLKSLSSHPPSSQQQQYLDKHVVRSSAASQGSRHTSHRSRASSTSKSPVEPAPTKIRPQSRSRSRSRSHSRSRPHLHSTSNPKAPSKAQLRMSALADHKSVPRRESLTKWKSEREEAKAEFDGIQRAKMKERVRRANEMELEKEKELQALGKGAEKSARVLGMGLKDGNKRSGCFGGLFRRVLGRVF